MGLAYSKPHQQGWGVELIIIVWITTFQPVSSLMFLRCMLHSANLQKTLNRYLYSNSNGRRKSLTAITQECCKQYWASPGDSTQQSSSYMTTYHPPRKLSKLDEPDPRDTAGEVGMNSWLMYSCGPLHIDKQKQDIQLEPTFSSSMPIWDVALRICWKQWTIGRCGERGSEISVLIVRHDDNQTLIVLKFYK